MLCRSEKRGMEAYEKLNKQGAVFEKLLESYKEKQKKPLNLPPDPGDLILRNLAFWARLFICHLQ